MHLSHYLAEIRPLKEEEEKKIFPIYITAWEFEGNIRRTNWGQLEIGEKEGKLYSGRRR